MGAVDEVDHASSVAIEESDALIQDLECPRGDIEGGSRERDDSIDAPRTDPRRSDEERLSRRIDHFDSAIAKPVYEEDVADVLVFQPEIDIDEARTDGEQGEAHTEEHRCETEDYDARAGRSR